VFLSEKDLEKLAAEMKQDRGGFVRTYCRWVTDWQGKEVLSLKEKTNKDCIFWDSGCTVYEKRPLQCRTFPFWESTTASEKAWEIAATGCHGMNTGKLHTRMEIDRYKKMRTAEPILNRKEQDR
jgi:Fe-S-cluster containining protein